MGGILCAGILSEKYLENIWAITGFSVTEILSFNILIVSFFSLITDSREVILVWLILISFFRYSICTASGDS